MDVSAVLLTLSNFSHNSNRTFTTDTPLPSHEEICGVSEAVSSLGAEGVDKFLSLVLDDDSQGRNRLAILPESVDPSFAELENDSMPLIAISRRSLQVRRDNPQSPPAIRYYKRPASEILSSSPGTDALKIKKPRIESEIRVEPEEVYEPSVLCFEDLVDTRMFYEFSDVRRLWSHLCTTEIFSGYRLIRPNCRPSISPSRTKIAGLMMNLQS